MPGSLVWCTTPSCHPRTRGPEDPRTRGPEDPFHGLVGSSDALRRACDLVRRYAGTATPVLIVGETGTGKELVARAIHAESPRAARRFAAVNCAAYPESLLDAQLFGHVKGAFTGADRAQAGWFEAAGGGTLFLDEIAELHHGAQAKLLRVLESGTVSPLGSTRDLAVNTRVVAATNLDPLAIRERVRQDLYFRLSGLQIRLPPLRERLDDLPALVAHLAARFAREANLALPLFAPEALSALRRHAWPGNIRELAGVVERLMLQAEGATVQGDDVEREIAGAAGSDGHVDAVAQHHRRHHLSPEARRHLVEDAMRRSHGNVTAAAAWAGVDRRTFQRWLAQLRR